MLFSDSKLKLKFNWGVLILKTLKTDGMKFNFSALSDSQVALLRADALTGDILDDKFELFLTESQNAYTVFESVNDARKYVDKTIKPMRSVEALVYNRVKEVVFYYDPAERN